MSAESTVYRNPVPLGIDLTRAVEGMLSRYFSVLDKHGKDSPEFRAQERTYWLGLAAVDEEYAARGVNPGFYRKSAADLRARAAKAA